MKLRNMVRLAAASACAVAGVAAIGQALQASGATTLRAADTEAHSICQTYAVLLAHSDGSVGMETPGAISCSTAPFLGSMAAKHLNAPIVGIATLPRSIGYWLVGADGGVFSYGNAQYFGSTGALKLNRPIVGIAATPDGLGYWLVASDGGVFAFGDAKYQGSTGNLRLNKPVVGMAVDGVTGGYWLVAADGGVFTFNAPYLGSLAALRLASPIRFITGTPDNLGYRMVGGDGGVFNFGDASYFGSESNSVGTTWQALTATQDGAGYWLFSNSAGGTGVSVASFGDAVNNLGMSGGDLSVSPIVSSAIYYEGVAPVVTQNPSSEIVSPGSAATFTAAASGEPAPTVQWQVSVDEGASYQNIVNATSTTLTFTTVQSENGGLYRAVFTNALGSATTTVATLTVGTAPTVTTNPQSQSVAAGGTATFTAAASGTPAPTVQWEQSINSGATWTVINGATSPTLSFTTASGQNGYEYRALFTNAAGQALTSAATLTVT